MNFATPKLILAFALLSVIGFFGGLILNVMSLLNIDTEQPAIVVALHISCFAAVLFTVLTVSSLPANFFDSLIKVCPSQVRPWQFFFLYCGAILLFHGGFGGKGKWVYAEYVAAITDTSAGTIALFSAGWMLFHSAIADFLFCVYKTDNFLKKQYVNSR